MNNRPLFWAVMCFALGEVLYIIAGRGSEISTALVVLICVAFIIIRLKLDWKKKFLYVIALVIGLVRGWYGEQCYMGNALFGYGEYETQQLKQDGYSISYLTGVTYDGNGYLREQVSVEGVGIVDQVAESGSGGYNVTVELLISKTGEIEITRAYKVIIYSVDSSFAIGDMVYVEGIIRAFVPTGNPGEFDRRSYYKARGIAGYGIGSNVSVLLVNEEVQSAATFLKHEELLYMGQLEKAWYGLRNSLNEARQYFTNVLYQICDDSSAEVYAGILLGDKGRIPDEDMLLYRLSGIAHIFAISGLHIGIVGGLLYKLLRKMGLRFLPSAGLAMGMTLLYGVMTGFSFSTIRAVVMLAMYLGGQVIGRKYDMLTGMGLALGILLVVEPYRMLDGGLLLSFGAVSGVVLAKYIIKLLEKRKEFRKLQKKKYRWLYSIISAIIFSVGINVVTTPLIAYMYYQVPLYSALLNMLVVPLMTLTVYCGFFGVLLGCVSTFWGGIVIYPGVISLKLYQELCGLFQKLPVAVINTGKPHIAELVLYYIVLLVTVVCLNTETIAWVRRGIHKSTRKWMPYERLRRIGILIVVMCVVVCGGAAMVVRSNRVAEEIVFLDVGQGDGAIICTKKGTNIVVDLGSSSNESLGEYVACPALLTQCRGTVDYWFISHFDKDHMSGLMYILQSDIDMGITIKNVVVSENSFYMEGRMSDDVIDSQGLELLELARKKGINVISMKTGDYITDGSFTMKALHPIESFVSGDRNEQSLVLSYESKEISVLFTGDVGVEAIGTMMDREAINVDYDILKVPHHGSRYSLRLDFLQATNPETAIVSCGRNNLYGHPHEQVVDAIYNLGCSLYRTDYIGAIRINGQ